MNKKIYSGVFNKGPNIETDAFIMDPVMNEIEKKLTPFYLLETIAHDSMLLKKELIPKNIGKKILNSLINILENEDLGNFIDPKIGDVHENCEDKLSRILGNDAGWMHTARSRNDQSLTDIKLYTKSKLIEVFENLSELSSVFLKKSNEYKDTIMPGFTHLRVATPSTFGFWWQAYLIQIIDCEKLLLETYKIIDKSPLGAGTSYGVNWPIDPQITSDYLGFSKPFENALAEMNSRGLNELYILNNFVVFLTILSRMMEDIIIWTMPELNLVSISENYTTGSSIMPQKVNPDIAEKIRAKAGKIIGSYVQVASIFKNTPSGYNRDIAETKIVIVQAFEELISTLNITINMLKTLVPNIENMKKMIKPSLATKLADTLSIEYKIPFRTAHKIIGKCVANWGDQFEGFTSEELNKIIVEFTEKNFRLNKNIVEKVLNIEQAISQYCYPGSPNPDYILKTNYVLENEINKLKKFYENEDKKFSEKIKKMITECKTLLNS